MKQESTVKYILRLTATLLAICAVVALALAGVNAITKDRIAAVKAEKTQKAIQAVIPTVEDLQEVSFTDETGMVRKVYRAVDLQAANDGETVPAGQNNYYAVEVAPLGFGGAITMMVGVNATGEVTGISIISHAETPGLGAVAAASTDKGAAFRDQFAGLVSGITIGSGENQIDSISGATISSQAIVNGVNAALDCIKNMG